MSFEFVLYLLRLLKSNNEQILSDILAMWLPQKGRVYLCVCARARVLVTIVGSGIR